MRLLDERLKELDDPSLGREQRALLRCRVASDLAYAGRYEAARDALGELWPGIGLRPAVDGLPPAVAAELLLQCGTLTCLFGGARSVPGGLERAQDLLTEAALKFQSVGRGRKASEAQCEMGLCYWRLGAYDEARLVLGEALKPLTEADAELKGKIFIRQALVEIWDDRYAEALSILREAEPVFESAGDALKGRWHGQKALALRRLASAERRPDYMDRAIIEHTAAIYHYERAGHERYCANNQNNLAYLLSKLGRHAEAHEHLDRAERIFRRLADAGSLAEVRETRARVLLAEGHYRAAERVVARAVETLERSGAAALLADALAVQGLVRARLGAHEGSLDALRRAVEVAEQGGALANAGRAALTIIEEHGAERLSATEAYGLYARADGLLRDTQDAEDIARLRACARLVVRRLAGQRGDECEFALPAAVHEYEARLIEQALDEAGGSVSRAAGLLGVRHQTLTAMLESRHRWLLRKRTPVRKRRRSIIRKKQ